MSVVTICVGQVGVCASGHYFYWPGVNLVPVVTISVGQVGVCASYYLCWPGKSLCQWSLFLLARCEFGASGHYFCWPGRSLCQ